MHVDNRSGFAPTIGLVIPVVKKARYWAIVIIACGVALAGKLYLPTTLSVQHTTPLNIPVNTTPIYHSASKKHSEITAPSPSVARPTKPHKSGTDVALQNLQRTFEKSTDSREKVHALNLYAHTTLATAFGGANDALERIISTMLDQDPVAARMAALDSSVPEVQLAAIANLANGNDDQAAATLAMVAGSPDPAVRRGAIEGLGLLLKKDPQVRYTLHYLMQSEMDPDNAMLIEDWLMNSDEVVK